MAEGLRNNPLACGLLGIIVGAGSILGGQALIGQSEPQTVKSSLFDNTTAGEVREETNFDRVPCDENGEVYITPNGKKYHFPKCHTLRKSSRLQQVSIEDAEAAGITPCSRCNPY